MPTTLPTQATLTTHDLIHDTRQKGTLDNIWPATRREFSIFNNI
jgi:hypothetical protein